MERLKVAIADKILEISSENPENIKQKLNKIQRFSDFAEACKTLMVKYPEIETDLLEMVRVDDFDALRASRRVDSIINREHKVSDAVPAYPQNQIPEVIPIITPPPVGEDESYAVSTEEDAFINEVIEEIGEDRNIPEESFIGDRHDTEELFSEEIHPVEETTRPEEVVFTMAEEEFEGNTGKSKRRKQLTLLWQILAIAVAIFVIVIVIKFVVSYWKTILIILGSALVIYLLWLYLRKRNKNKPH